MSKVAIIGTGGFAREVYLILNYSGIEDEIVFAETDENYSQSEIMGVPVIKQSELTKEYELLIGIGEPNVRQKVYTKFKDFDYTSIIHPTVVTSQWVTIGDGSVICAGSILTCNINIGIQAQLNLHTTIGHDCKIGDFFTTAPGAKISGACTIGNNVYIGTNASVKQGISICDNVTIGMGATVVKNITEPGIYVGMPAKKLER